MVKGKGKKSKKSKEKFSFKSLNTFDNYIVIAGLALSAILGYSLRAWPLRFGRLLGYDPYFFLREAGYYLSGGLPEIDPMAPTVVRHLAVEDVQGIPVLTSTIARLTGVELLSIHMYLPIFLGIIGSILLFFVAYKAWGNKYIALISSFFLAIMPAFIYRTSGGGMWKDTVGSFYFIIFMLIAIFILKERDRSKIIVYGALSLITLFLYANTFGNFFFVPLIVATYVLLKPVVKESKKEKELKLKEKIFKDFDMWVLVCVSFISLIYARFLIPTYEYESTRLYLGMLGLLFAAIINFSGYFVKERKYYIAPLVGLSVVLIIIAEFALNFNILGYVFGDLTAGISGQTQAITFSNFVDKFYLFPIMGLLGVIYGAYQILHYHDVKPTLFILSAFAFVTFMSYQMIRNTFFGGITFAIVAAFGFMGIYELLTKKLSHKKALSVTIIVFVAFSSFSLYNPLDQTYGGSIPYRTSQSPHLTDSWLTALLWLNQNTPEDEVLCNWWDYGYWMQTVAERRTISDNMQSGMGPWMAGFSGLLASRDSEGIQKIIEMEQEAYLRTGNQFKMNYVIVDQSLLIKTGVLNRVIGREAFATAYFFFRGTTQINNLPAYVYESGNTRLFFVMDSENPYCYIEQDNQRYGVSNFVIENPNGQNHVFENIQYNFPTVSHLIYITPQNAIMMPEAIKDTLFARMIVYESGLENFSLAYDNGYVKIYRILR